MKIQFKNALTGLQIIVVCVLFLVGVFLFLGVQPYRHEVQEPTDAVEYPFLQKGSYTLQLTYVNSPADNSVVVISYVMPHERGELGVEYARMAIPEGSGVVRIPLEVEEGAYNVWLSMLRDGGEDCYLQDISLQSNNLLYKDRYFFGLLFFVAAAVLLYCFLMLPAEKYGTPVVLVLIGLAASLPLMSRSLIGGDDLEFHLTRLEGIYLGLRAGEFPVRITSQQMQGYGGLTAVMYPQLFLYPAAVLRFLGVSLMNCYKLLLVAINVGTAFAAYYAAKNICKSHRAGLFMSVLYTFALYRLTNLYTRAALGEVLAMTFLPLVIWGTYEVLWGRHRWIVLVLGMTGVLQSHVLSVEMSALFMLLELVLWLVSRKKKQFVRRIWDGVKAVAVTVLLNAGFWVPFLRYCTEDLQCFMLPPQTGDTVAYFSQMFALFPGVLGKNIAAGSTQGEMPLTVGGVLLLGLVIFAYACREKRDDVVCGIGVHCALYGVLALLMASWIFPWARLEAVSWLEPLCSSIQFAWRFLGPASVFLCMTTAIGLDGLLRESDSCRWVLALCAGLTLAGAWNLFDKLAYEQFQYEDTMELEGYCLADGMYMYRESDVFEPLQLKYNRWDCHMQVTNGTAVTFAEYERSGSGLTVRVTPESGKVAALAFPIYYYPGYAVTVDGQEVVSGSYEGLLSCEVSGDTALVEVEYKGFWYFAVADIVTALTVFAVLAGGVYRGFGKKRVRA